MNQIAQLFYQIDEPYAAGLFEEPERSLFYRHALANARYLEHSAPAAYAPGDMLYPGGRSFFETGRAVCPQFALTYQVDWDRLRQKSQEAHDILQGFYSISHCPGGWTHAAPNYKRIIREGLAGYRQRVLAQPDGDFKAGLLHLLDGMESYIRRAVEALRAAGAPAQLTDALALVPFAPAQTYYQGLVAWNMIFYFDGCDNLGYLDDGLAHLYRGEDLTPVIRELFRNIDQVGNWSCTIGARYNAVTVQALRAIRGMRRPLLELRVAPDMPDELWQLAADNIRSGATNPSFYNETGIHAMLRERFPHIPDCELDQFVGCGCTETNLQGMTRAGGTDDDIPLLKIFEQYMHANLALAPSFEAFYQGLCQETRRCIHAQLDQITARYRFMAAYLPNPIRTLFTDDCIEKGLDFNAGGARYTWTQSSDSGLINVADSLLAIRQLVYREQRYTPQEFLRLLSAQGPAFYAQLKACPCFGVDDPDADALAADFAAQVYSVYREKPPADFIDAYILTEHQFLRYEPIGQGIGPTPDGRRAGDPTCDSIAALRGKATDGPTAMLKSAARLPQHLADGISVLNLTISKTFVDSALRALVQGYFALGGIQVQVSCTSAGELRDALQNPEKHRDLIVRVGGYSDYFINLTPALRKAVVERNVHELM